MLELVEMEVRELLSFYQYDGDNTPRQRYIENGMIDFLMKEREAGRIRNLGFSFHGTVDVFDEVLAMHESVHWDFVQIQLNYVDWKHASGRNVNADYLYGELEKRNIPAIIMEPLLGGRLSKVPDHIATRLKQRKMGASVASWAFRADIIKAISRRRRAFHGINRGNRLRDIISSIFRMLAIHGNHPLMSLINHGSHLIPHLIHRQHVTNLIFIFRTESTILTAIHAKIRQIQGSKENDTIIIHFLLHLQRRFLHFMQ